MQIRNNFLKVTESKVFFVAIIHSVKQIVMLCIIEL